MPGEDFFKRLWREFTQHSGSARANAARQADLERLITKAEYEFYQARRELEAVVEYTQAPSQEANAAPELAPAPKADAA